VDRRAVAVDLLSEAVALEVKARDQQTGDPAAYAATVAESRRKLF
jgi:hypothetical protein